MAARPFAFNAIAVGGGPESGALFNSYIRSTSTRSPLYTSTDIDPVTGPKKQNPFASDGDGRCFFYFDPDIQYTWRCTTADGATIILECDVVDGVLSNVTSDTILIDASWVEALNAALGAGWAELLADNITGIIARTKTEWRGFGGAFDSNGTAGNGTDNLSAINSALAFVGAAGGGEVILPPGIGRFTDTIVNPYDFVHLRGAGEGTTGIFIDNALAHGYQDGSTSSLADSNTVSDLYFFRAAASSCYAVRLFCSDRLTLSNVQQLSSGGIVGNGIALGIPGVAITAAANNGSGLIRITAASHGFETGCRVKIGFVVGTTEANSIYTVTKITDNTFDLQGSTFANAYVSGGLVAPTTSNFYPHDVRMYFADVGLGVFACAGGVVGSGDVSFVGTKRTGNFPTAGTYGLYFPKGTTPYLRFDFITGIKGFASADKNIFQENTRVVNVELDGIFLDDFRTKCVHLQNDSPDSTGAGVEVFHIRNGRSGLNTAAAEQLIVVNATAASVASFSAKGFAGTSALTAVEITAHTSSFVFSGDLDDLNVDLRPVSGSRSVVDLTGYMDRVSVRGLKAASTSSTFGVDAVKVNSGVTGDVVVDDIQALNFGGKLCNDVAGIVRAPFEAGRNVKVQSFVLVLWNDGGTLKHRIGSWADEATAAPAQRVNLITGATTTFTATPTGTDASTAFAAGLKVKSSDTSTLIFDIPAQVSANVHGNVVVGYNDSDTAVAALPGMLSSSVNGVTRNRLTLFMRDAATGAAFNLPGSMDSGEFVYLNCELWLAP